MKVFPYIIALLFTISCSTNKDENDKSVQYLTALVMSNRENNGAYSVSKSTVNQNTNNLNSESKNPLPKEPQADFSTCSLGLAIKF